MQVIKITVQSPAFTEYLMYARLGTHWVLNALARKSMQRKLTEMLYHSVRATVMLFL